MIFGALLISFFYPLRYLPAWWVNPVWYGLLTLACLLATIRFVQHHPWDQRIVLVMLACPLMAGLNSIIRFIEIGHCRVEDVRYTQVIACDSRANVMIKRHKGCFQSAPAKVPLQWTLGLAPLTPGSPN